MEKKIKLIWDFRGPESLEIARHHCEHLKEFAIKEKLPFYEIATQTVSEMYCMAFVTVSEKDMKIYRDALLPHRGELVKNK